MATSWGEWSSFSSSIPEALLSTNSNVNVRNLNVVDPNEDCDRKDGKADIYMIIVKLFH